jgi:hypothetical protein
MDVVDAPSAVPSLWNAIPGVVQKPPRGLAAHSGLALRSPSIYEHHADPLDGFAIRGCPQMLYHEQAFQYLLEIERRRAESTRRPFLLMLLECDETASGPGSGSDVRPERLFPVVCRSLRETDFVGWYRQGAVVGATLTQDGRRGTEQAPQIVRERILKALGTELPPELVSQLRLRLYEVMGDDELRMD